MRHTESNAIKITIEGTDGLSLRIWRNPEAAELVKLVVRSDGDDGMRCLLTVTDFFFWQSATLLHNGFIKHTGIDGLKIALRRDAVLANFETIAAPEAFPWVFENALVDELDIEERREVVESWLRRNDRLQGVYGAKFPVRWYS
jgi:hypothetical protein